MPRYIDAEPLEQLAAAMINQYRQSGQEEYELLWHGKMLFITNAPTADVAPVVHGRWEDLRISYNDVPRYNCTNCGVVQYTATRHKYCPNCGAKMDAEVVHADS